MARNVPFGTSPAWLGIGIVRSFSAEKYTGCLLVLISLKPARLSLRASSRCEMGTSLGIGRTSINVQTHIASLSWFARGDFLTGLQATFNSLHSVPISFL